MGLVEGGNVGSTSGGGEGEAVSVLSRPSANLFAIGVGEPFVEFVDGGEVQVLDHLANPAAGGVLRNDKVEGARVVHNLVLVGGDGGLDDGVVGSLGVQLVVFHDARVDAAGETLRGRINDVESFANFREVQVSLDLVSSAPVGLIRDVALGVLDANVAANVEDVDVSELLERTLFEGGEALFRGATALDDAVAVELLLDEFPVVLSETASTNGDVVDDPRSDVAVSAVLVDVRVDVFRDDVLIPPGVNNTESFNIRSSPGVTVGPAGEVDHLRGLNTSVVDFELANEGQTVVPAIRLSR